MKHRVVNFMTRLSSKFPFASNQHKKSKVTNYKTTKFLRFHSPGGGSNPELHILVKSLTPNIP